MTTFTRIPASIVRRYKEERRQVRRGGNVETARKHGYPYRPSEWYAEDHFTFPFRSCITNLRRIADLGIKSAFVSSVVFASIESQGNNSDPDESFEMFVFDKSHQPAINFTLAALRELGMNPALVCEATVSETGELSGNPVIRVQ